MTIQSGGSARELCAAADEALTQAWFCTGAFAEAERLFSDAAAAATRDGETAALARAASGLSQARHGRNVATLVAGGVPTEADISAEEDLAGRALGLWRETGDPAGTGRALFDMSLVFQVLAPAGIRPVRRAGAPGWRASVRGRGRRGRRRACRRA